MHKPNNELAIQLAKKFAKDVKNKYPDATRVVLFGSRARGDFRNNSDIDLAVFLDGESLDYVSTKFDLRVIAIEFTKNTVLRIEPIPIWECEVGDKDRFPNQALIKNILQEGVAL